MFNAAIIGVSGFGDVHYRDLVREHAAGRVNIVAATVISTLVYAAHVVANHALFSIIPGVVGQWLGAIPFLTVGIPAVISLYFDWFGSFMQAFIFCMLTMMFISTAAE